MSAQYDKERLLGILHAHGQQFLSAFDTPASPKHEKSYSSEPEEWSGFDPPTTSSDHESDGDIEQEDDGFVAGSSHTSNVMVFQEPTRKPPEANFLAKELRKSFMSPKVSNITSSPTHPVPKKKVPGEESDDERTDVQNDALLHRLVHTKLLSGSLNPELELDHAQKGRALAGRVLEIAGEAKLGKGESLFRQEQRNKAAKRIRDGLIRKQKERDQKTLEEAKNLGNYHPTLKRLYDSQPSSGPKKRVRSLGMGVGRFSGGILKLTREEIASVTGSDRRSRSHDRRGMRQRQPR